MGLFGKSQAELQIEAMKSNIKNQVMGNSYGPYGNSLSSNRRPADMSNSELEHLIQTMIIQQEKYSSSYSSKQTEIIESTCNIKYVTSMIKTFKLDYSTGEEILNLVKSNDKDNETMAMTMLFAAMRDNLKQEIINEINKK